MDDDWVNALKRAWQAQKQFSKAAQLAKHDIDRWRGPLILCSMLGAAAAVVSHEYSAWFDSAATFGPTAVGVSGTLALACAAYLTKEVLSPKLEKTWTRCRSIAEAVKAECFRFAVGVAPYTRDKAGVDAFNDRVDALTNHSDLEVPPPDPLPTGDIPAMPLTPIDIGAYVLLRAAPQEVYFRAQGQALGTKDSRWRAVSITLAVISIVVSAVGSGLKSPAATALVPIVTTVIAAVTSYVIAMRFHATAMLYNATAFQLNRLAARPKDMDYVAKCEQVLAASNLAWVAEWSRAQT